MFRRGGGDTRLADLLGERPGPVADACGGIAVLADAPLTRVLAAGVDGLSR